MTHPGGTVGIISGRSTALPEFVRCVMAIDLPEGSHIAWVVGLNVAENNNQLVLQHRGEWLWFLGDDHQFDPSLLKRMLDQDKDIVVPLCAMRKPPFGPTAFVPASGEARKKGPYSQLQWGAIPPTGVFSRVAGELVRTGQAGMLVRSHVFKKMKYPWFELGKIDPTTTSEDLWFCEKAIADGFEIFIDAEAEFGHITTATIWPTVLKSGRRGVKVDLDRDIVLGIDVASRPKKDAPATADPTGFAYQEEPKIDTGFFDRWRESTREGTLSYADQQYIHELIAKAYPKQEHFTWHAVSAFIERLECDRLRVLEIGGWKGELAERAFRTFGGIDVWLNLDITPSVKEQSVCKRSSYLTVIPDKYVWEESDWNIWGECHDANTMILSHIIEHLTADQLAWLITKIPPTVEAIYVEAPIPDEGPVDWSGYLGTHILEWGWKEVLEQFAKAGFEVGNSAWKNVRMLRRTKIQVETEVAIGAEEGKR